MSLLTTTSFRPGDLLDHYRLEELVATGGMASIFRATDTKTGRPVAVKIPHPDKVGDRLALDRLEELGKEVDSARARDDDGQTALSTADVDDLLRKLRQLRRDDPRSADDILRRLVDEAGPATAQTVTS